MTSAGTFWAVLLWLVSVCTACSTPNPHVRVRRLPDGRLQVDGPLAGPFKTREALAAQACGIMTSQPVRALALVLLASGVLSGCSLLAYYKLPKAERASPEESVKVRFPDSLDGAVELTGPMAAALEVAMNDFLPPGATVRMTDGYKPLEQCLSRRQTYDAVVLPYGEDWFYVLLTPRIERCGLGNDVLDLGAEYVIDGQGRILAVR
jgi:hypothetical protein